LPRSARGGRTFIDLRVREKMVVQRKRNERRNSRIKLRNNAKGFGEEVTCFRHLFAKKHPDVSPKPLGKIKTKKNKEKEGKGGRGR